MEYREVTFDEFREYIQTTGIKYTGQPKRKGSPPLIVYGKFEAKIEEHPFGVKKYFIKQ